MKKKYGQIGNELVQLMVLGMLLTIMAGWGIAPLFAAESASFSAAIEGSFAITGGVGESPLFVVQENGTSYGGTLGDFVYETYLLHNLALRPEGCGRSSSTGVGGSATLTFADGSQVRLNRQSGTACFTFPTIHVEEQWAIASGTGDYIGATGTLSRVLDGDVRTGAASGVISGSIRMP